MQTTDHPFEKGRETYYKQNSCLRCGKTEESHKVGPPVSASPPVQEVVIVFNGRLHKYRNWQEAQKDGFYLG